MASLEHGFYSIERYLVDSAGRIDEDELVVDELYTVAFALQKTWRRRHEAIRLLSRVGTVSQLPLSPSFYEVEFTIYDTGLRPTVREKAMFRHGFWQQDFSMPLQINRQEVIGGYFGRYVPDPDQELEAIVRSADIPVNGAYAA